MKRLAAVALAALMLLSVFAASASAASTVEIRGPVYEDPTGGEDFSNFDFPIEMNGTNFAAFFFDLDEGISTEKLSILGNGIDGEATDNRRIPEEALEYTTSIERIDFEYIKGGWTEDEVEVPDYPVLGFFAEKYIPIEATSPDKLAKLLIDDDEKYTLRTGEVLDLGNGYALEAKQVDVDGKKVWLEFTKDGEFIDDEIIEIVDEVKNNNWEIDLDDIEDKDDIIVLRVHVNQVFQGAVDSIAQIEGLWLIDYENAFTVESDDTFGNLEVNTIGSDYLSLLSNSDITLTEDDTEEIGEDMSFKIADSDTLRFYVMKEFTEPDTYEIRGQIVEGDEAKGFIWDYSTFAGFFYDLDDGTETESLEILNTTLVTVKNNSIEIDDNQLVYTTTIGDVQFEYNNSGWTNEDDEVINEYPVLGFFAEEYIPIDENNADKLAKLLIDNDDKYTLRTGEQLDLGDGYALEAKQVDVDGKKVWLEFSKDGEFVDDEIIEIVDDIKKNNWQVDLDDIEDKDDVVVLRVHVNQVFQGAVDSIAQIEGIWLIDYTNAFTIESDDEYGALEVSVNGKTLELSNKNSITIDKDETERIAEGMAFKSADNDDADGFVRFFPFVERTIEGEGGLQAPDEDDKEEPPVGNVTTPDVNVTAPDVNVTAPDVDVTAPADDDAAPAENDTAAPEEETPGFGFVFGLVGLLSVVYLVRRN